MTLDYLRELTDEQLHAKCFDPKGEEIDVLSYAASIIAHDMYHLEQLTAYLANEAAVLH
jgi:ribonuclease HIII